MNKSIAFFDSQFQRQIGAGDLALNPFETAALSHLRGRVLDFGCGLGNLAVAAARKACSVLALDASPTAIRHLGRVAAAEGLDIEAVEADLRTWKLAGTFDTVVSIGLLMFLERAVLFDRLAMLQEHLEPGGTAIINILVQGTTYLDMFDGPAHCLLSTAELADRFAGWDLTSVEQSDFPAPGGLVKSFATVTARKPR